MTTRGALSEAIELLSSDSESEVTVGGTTVKPRPKLRTGRSSVLEESDADAQEVAPPAKRRREASRQIQYLEEEDEDEDEGDEVDQDETGNYEDQPETPSEDERLPEEDTNRRRSGRVRRPAQVVIDLSDDGFVMSSEEEEEKPKLKKRAPKGKSKGKKKRKRSSSSEDELDDSDVEIVETRVKPEIDGFIIDKVLGREVHTQKEWKKMCWNKNSRFLTHCSIFLPNGEEEENPQEKQEQEEKLDDGKPAAKEENLQAKQEQEKTQDIEKPAAAEKEENLEEKQEQENTQDVEKPAATAKEVKPDEKQEQEKTQDNENPAAADTEAPATPKASTDDEVEDPGEERFLVKWKTLSYLHTSWQTEDELLETDKNAKGKIQRFREKELRALYTQDVQGDEYFNPEFRSVDRILDIRDRPLDDFAPDDCGNGENKFKYFLIKWKALPYDEITWEHEVDVGDDAAVEQYNERIMRAAKRFRKIALAKHTPHNKRKNFRGYTAEAPPPRKKEQAFQLRDYQLTGVNWMLFNWYQKRNSMLADEMGLGKTVQTVMYINHLAIVERTPQPFIIVAPLSTLGHWQREFDSWTNLNAVVYHGSAAARDVLQNYEFFMSEDELLRADELCGKKSSNGNGKRSSPRPKRNCYRFDVLITTYEMASATDLYKLAQIDWQLMVVDEAHRLKNRNSKLSNILHTRFKYENMLLLTGTPLQNNVEELWVLLNFLDQKKFGSKETFLESFGELTDSAQVEKLHSELKPYLLRRMKEDVEKSLAPKEETIIEVELTVLQKQYYRAIYEKNTEFLSRGGRKGDTPSLMNVLMELRKCCNHPFLVKGVEEREVKRLFKQTSVSKEEIQRQVRDSLVDTSGKLVLLDKLLPRLKETGHRVLIFSQFKIMLDILQDYLAFRRYNCERIDGNITGNERQSAIDRFSREDSNSFIMLLSTRAGGVGINLTAADTVIIYDSDWNPQNDLQAQARCHRIGQKKSVKIYRLLTSKTYELHMFHKASLKLGLDQAVLGGIKNDDPVAKLKGAAKKSNTNDRMSKEEIENLLKHGAYEMFKEQESEAEAASKKFGEESIEQILSRSTTIVHDPTRDTDGNAKKNAMSSFSKATFVSSTNPDVEVDVDDPNFWTKVIGLNGVEEQKKVEPSPLLARRCRRKVQSYLIDDDKSLMEDSGDEASAARKKPSRELGVQKDEEFVISDDDDDEDDDEDLSDIAMAKNDLLGISGNGKRKRSKVPVLPIHSHTERIVDLLMGFGYGRWGDMKRHAPMLQVYSDKELCKFVQDYITSLVRVATALVSFQRIGLDLEPGRVYIVSTITPPVQMGNASPIERFAQDLNNACRRYRFLTAMLEDMKVSNVLAVAVPPRMWIADLKSRVARGCRSKLQQIESMYKLSQFVQQKLVPTSFVINMIKDLQQIGNEAQVHEMIESGTIPVFSAANTTGSDPEKEAFGRLSDEMETVKPVSKPSPQKVIKSGDGEGEAKKENISSSITQEQLVEPAATVATDEVMDDESVAPSKSANNVISKEAAPPKSADHVGKDSISNSSTGSTGTSEASTSEVQSESASLTVTDSRNEGGNDASDPNEKKDTKKIEDSDHAESEDTSHNEKTRADDKKGPSGSPNALSEAAKHATPGAAPENAQTDKISKADRKHAMRILQTLPPVNSPEAVAPWWISRVDDVALLLFIHRDGWIKGRSLSMRLVETSTLFGERARRYPTSEWPTVAGLNRRIKVLLQLWTAVKKTKPVPASPSIAAALNVTSASEYRHQQRQQEQLQQQLQRQQEQQRAQQARHYSRASFHGSRHNQFAKLIFSYGIPDVSTCRDDRERNEKWRYFLQDSHLGIGQCPLEELLAEALDLERVCRQRLRNDADGMMSEPSEENSILGGKRGFWLLTTTQCRRLLHRVDLFRLLRSQILVLPPAQLVELVTRVVQAQGTSTDYPVWWSCPRHDILLLQGVECYGLDEHLASVWKLPLFNAANKKSAFPSSSWVENYVSALGFACHDLMAKSRVYHNPSDGYVSSSDAQNVPTDEATDRYPTRPEPVQEAETRRRIRDIRGMREEDPYFVPTVRLRQLIESNAGREKASVAQPPKEAQRHKPGNVEDGSLPTATEEASMMKQEEPYESKRVQKVGGDWIKRDEIESAQKRTASATGSSSEEEKGAPSSADTVIDLENDEDADDIAAAKPTQPSPSQADDMERHPASAKTTVQTPVAQEGDAAAAADRSWEVIVIDDSDSE